MRVLLRVRDFRRNILRQNVSVFELHPLVASITNRTIFTALFYICVVSLESPDRLKIIINFLVFNDTMIVLM